MKVASIATLALCSATAFADVFVQRNGIDGSFVWWPWNTYCFGGTPKHLNISLPLSQSGASGSRTLSWDAFCYYPFTCSGPYLFKVYCNGSDVQVASGSTFRYQPNCGTGDFQTPGPRGYQPGEYVDSSTNWTDRFTYGIGQARNPVYIDGQNEGFWGVRIQLADGWHYGWLKLFQRTNSTTGTFDGYYVPGAYALEMTPDTPIRIPCRADINYDGVIDLFDYLDYIALFAANDPGVRYNTDLVLDLFDYLDFVSDYAAGDC